MIDARRILDRALAAAKGSDASFDLTTSRTGSTRFAVDQVTSSSVVERASLTVTAYDGQRSAGVVTNQVDDASILAAVARAKLLAKLVPPNPEQMPLLGAQKYAQVAGVDAATASLSPDARAKAAATAIAAGKGKAQMAGYYESSEYTRALATTKGLVAQHRSTGASMSITARTPDGSGSGWAGIASNRAGDVDAAALAKVAVDKAARSTKAQKLEPGRYTVILEPAAVAELIGFFVQSLAARPADEGRSYFAKNRPGAKLFADNITLRTALDPQLQVSPFDEEGLPRAPRTWVDKGVLEALYYDRYWAQHEKQAATAGPGPFELAGGTANPLEGVKRGVLITRFWYTNLLDPMALMCTGSTRDGTFLVEDGKITRPVNNFRFNESPITVMAKCDALGPAVLTYQGSRVPALRTHDFNLASVEEAV